MKSILLLGAGTGSPDAVVRFKRLGLRIVMVELREVFDSAKCQAADEIILTDYTVPGFLDFAMRLRESWHFDLAISITEVGVAVAAQINERLGVRRSDLPTINRLKDKAAMRAWLDAQGFSPVAYRVIEHDDDIDAIAATAGFPLIVKPHDGGGSLGIHLAHDAGQAREAAATLRSEGLTPLAEKYIDGREYSVESFSFEGRHFIAAITEKLVNDQFIEIGHVVPARLDVAAASEVACFVEKFLALIGVTNGPGHTEIKIGSTGLKIIESHNRVGGDNIPKLVELANGIDLISLTAQWACGMVDAGIPLPVPNGAAAIHFFVFSEGEVAEVRGLQEAVRDPATVDYRCVYTRGDIVQPLTSNSTRAGYVVVRQETPDEAVDKAARLAGGIVAVMA